MTRQHLLIIVLFVGAAVLRFADVFRPIDHPSWRECDLGSIARNFATESMDPRYPAIDWRGDGPGYTEMELPIYPWLIAVTYKVTGIHDQVGRVWAFIFSLGAMFVFFKLAREYLSVFAATIAFAFFALNPLMIGIATAIQPEGLMLMLYLSAIFLFLRWLSGESRGYYWSAVVVTTLAILSKAPSAHIGVLFAVLVFEKWGFAAMRKLRVWAFGLLALLPSSLWYYHAKNLWLEYGNSLGVSNEYHWIGWDFFTDPQFISGIARIEFIYIWAIFGLIVGAFAVRYGYKTETVRTSLVWLASVFAFYLIAARTTSEDWSIYYHAFSIPPVALLFGSGISHLWEYARRFSDEFSRKHVALNVYRVAVIATVIIAVIGSLGLEAKQVRANFLDGLKHDNPPYSFAMDLKPDLTTRGPIVVSGGTCRDPKGYPVAYNASYMFYWLERRGWNICTEDHTLSRVRDYKDRGAVYFIAERSFVPRDGFFLDEMRSAFPVVAGSESFEVFDLKGGK